MNSAKDIFAAGIPLSRAEDLLLVINTPKGRGVFAGRDIPARTLLEVSPVLVLDPEENERYIRKTELYNYTYNWPFRPLSQPKFQGDSMYKAPTTTQAIALGLGSMFNHSTCHQNVGWERDPGNLLITYTTIRDVKKGEELCISYGARLNFKDSDAEKRKNDETDDWTAVMDIKDLID